MKYNHFIENFEPLPPLPFELDLDGKTLSLHDIEAFFADYWYARGDDHDHQDGIVSMNPDTLDYWDQLWGAKPETVYNRRITSRVVTKASFDITSDPTITLGEIRIIENGHLTGRLHNFSIEPDE